MDRNFPIPSAVDEISGKTYAPLVNHSGKSRLAVPIAKNPKYPKIKIESNTKLVMEATESVNRNKNDLPLAITKQSNTHCPIMPREPNIQIDRYGSP